MQHHRRPPDEQELVLIVDDAADVRQLAGVALSTHGFAIAEAETAQGALTAARQQPPICVLVDINMPGTSGIDLCERLRSEPTTKDAAIVMLTSADDAADKILAFAAGADDYIIKPFAPRDLSTRVRAAIQRRASR